MLRGYVRLWRKSLDSEWIKNHKLWAFWSWCLLKASHKEYDAIVGYQVVRLLPGEFIFGRHSAAQSLGMTDREIRTCLTTLKTTSNVTIKTTNKYSIISIVNWDTYQQDEIINDQQSDQQSDKPTTSKRPANDHKQTHKNISLSKDKDIIKPEKIIYYKNVRLTADEVQRLNADHGQDITNKAIKFLSDYKIEKKYKTNDDNLTIRRWVIDAVTKGGNNNGAKGTTASFGDSKRPSVCVEQERQADAINERWRREKERELHDESQAIGDSTGNT